MMVSTESSPVSVNICTPIVTSVMFGLLEPCFLAVFAKTHFRS